jgi:hypothetical protein
MATQSLQTPLRYQFPRYHRHCDMCGGEGQVFRIERDTAAGSFARCICSPCLTKLGKMSHERRAKAEAAAMVRHAARYSPEFGAFVARWYGVRNVPEMAIDTTTAVTELVGW